MQRNKKIYKLLHQIHLYGGLYCAAFLFIMGFSALFFQHPSLMPERIRSEKISHATVNPPLTNDSDSLAHAIQTELDIVGYVPWWLWYTDSLGNFNFEIVRPGKIFKVKLLTNKRDVEITKMNKSLLHTIRDMHTSVMGEPALPVLKIWRVYAESSALVALITLIISIYFWIKRSVRKDSHWYFISITAFVSIFYIIYIWLVG